MEQKCWILISFWGSLKDQSHSFLPDTNKIWVETKFVDKVTKCKTDVWSVIRQTQETRELKEPQHFCYGFKFSRYTDTDKHMNWPQSLQSTVWTLQSRTQNLHSWILQVDVVTQVQFCQMGGVELQSWGQRITADLWQPAVNQSEKRIYIV